MKAVEKILKKHIFTQNSLIDETGHNHWNDLIRDLEEHAEKRVGKIMKEVSEVGMGMEVTGGYFDMGNVEEARKHFEVCYEMLGEITTKYLKRRMPWLFKKPTKKEVEGK